MEWCFFVVVVVESPGSNHVSLCYFSAGSVSSKRWKVEHWDIIPVWLVFQKQTLFLILNLRAEISSSLQLRFSVIDLDLDFTFGMIPSGKFKAKLNDPDVIRTHSLLIWSQMRYHCATRSSCFFSFDSRFPHFGKLQGSTQPQCSGNLQMLKLSKTCIFIWK